MVLVAHLHLARRLLLPRGGDVKEILGAGEADVDDSPPLADRELDRRFAWRGRLVARVLLATPVLHHETQTVGVEEEPLGVAGSRGPQVDQEHDRELEALGGVDGEQRHGVGGGRLARRLSHRQLGVDDLVQVTNEVADARERKLAFEARRQLEDLAQVQQRAGAAVSLRTQLRPAKVSSLLEQPVQDVRHGERIAEAADAIREVNQRHRAFRDLRLHLREPFDPRRLEAIAQAHAVAAESPGRHSVQATIGEAHDRPLEHAHQSSVVHRVLGEAKHRQLVLDFLAVEETRAAARQIRDALAPELVLKVSREHADGVSKDRDVREGAAAAIQPPDGLGHRARLGPRVWRHDYSHRPAAGAARRDEVGLVREIRIAPDERRGAIEDLLERSTVVRERESRALEPAADVLDLGVAPAVDRLLRVADHGHVPEVVRGQESDEVELDPVGVLELVDEQIAEPFAAAPAELGHSLEGIDHLEDQVVEIAQPAGRQRFFVRLVNEMKDLDRLQLRMRGLARGGIVRRVPVLSVQLEGAFVEAHGRDASAFELEQESQPRAEEVVQVVDAQSREGVGIEWGGLAAAQARHQPLLEQSLPGLVEHLELAGRPDQVSELVEKARADAVEGSDPGTVEDLRSEIGPARHQLISDARPQLVGGAIVEGYGQDLAGRHSMLDQPAETFGRGGGLARTRTRPN